MKIFTVLGLAIFIFSVMAITAVLMNLACHVDEMFDGLGFIFVMIVLSIVLSLFFTQPEKFGYEKIISNDSVEQEVEE